MRYGKGSKPMSHIPMNALTSLCVVLGIAVVGCGDVPSSQQTAQIATGIEAPKVENPNNERERSQTYVNCLARFTTFENDHPWFDDSSVGHDDGKAPLASFVLVEPATYANLAIGILFKYTVDADTASPPDQEDIGSQFAFQIPADFFPAITRLSTTQLLGVFAESSRNNRIKLV
jgi:hypothetical protein